MRRQRGFTYLAVLFLIALMGAGLASLGAVWQTAQQRDKERELLFVGAQFRQAIQLYYEKTPGTAKQYPKTLTDLLQDKRALAIQRYLRRIYVDPMTGKAEWGLVKAVGGGIKGVYSLSSATAIKTGNFTLPNRDFEGKSNIADWQFAYEPKVMQAVAPPGLAVAPGASASAGAATNPAPGAGVSPLVAGVPATGITPPAPGSPGVAGPQGAAPDSNPKTTPAGPVGFAIPPPPVPEHGS